MPFPAKLVDIDGFPIGGFYWGRAVTSGMGSTLVVMALELPQLVLQSVAVQKKV